MNWGRAFGLGISSFTLILATHCATPLASGAQNEELADDTTDWEEVADNQWSRILLDDGNGSKAKITLTKMGSIFEYRIAIHCPPNDVFSDTFSWKTGDSMIKRVRLCRGEMSRLNVKEWEKLFYPLPDEVNGRKPEIFIEPYESKILA